MRIQCFRLLGVGLLGLVAAMPSSAHATTCYGGAPVLLRPVPSAPTGVNQFTFQVPMAPSLTGASHYLLVDDFPETHVSAGISTGYFNITSGTPRSELFYVAASEPLEGLQFSSCRIRSHMIPNGSSTTAYLVVKQGGVQNDGAGITVDLPILAEYQRVMPLNPITNQPWTGDDLVDIIIGVKNTAAPFGVGFADIALECQ